MLYPQVGPAAGVAAIVLKDGDGSLEDILAIVAAFGGALGVRQVRNAPATLATLQGLVLVVGLDRFVSQRPASRVRRPASQTSLSDNA